MLDEEPTVEQLRGMLLLRSAQIEQTLADEHARLRRVEGHLKALEGASPMSMQDVVIKQTEPLRVAAITDVSEGLGLPLGPVFGRMVPLLLARLQQARVSFRMMVAWYEEPADDGSVVVHTRPVGRSRELYREWHDDDPSRCVTELQMPIAPAAG